MQQPCRRDATHEHRHMILVSLCWSGFDYLPHEVQGCHRSHAAQDPDQRALIARTVRCNRALRAQCTIEAPRYLVARHGRRTESDGEFGK
jgi:hypothetical protein